MLTVRSGVGGDRLLVLTWHNIESTWRYRSASGAGRRAFARQLQVLRRLTNVVPLEAALSALQTGRRLPPRAVALTFDDGYRDNLTDAVPVLARLGMPATIFLVPGFLSDRADAWWERLAWALSSTLGTAVRFQGKRLALTGEPERWAARSVIENALKRSDQAARHAAVEELVDELSPRGRYDHGELFLDWDGARELVRSGVVTVGSHTMCHAILARELPSVQFEDLGRSRQLLQDELGTAIDTLAYPNGGRDDYDATTIAAAEAAGYAHAVVAWGAAHRRQAPRYEVQRMMVSIDADSSRFAVRVARELARVDDDRFAAPHR